MNLFSLIPLVKVCIIFLRVTLKMWEWPGDEAKVCNEVVVILLSAVHTTMTCT